MTAKDAITPVNSLAVSLPLAIIRATSLPKQPAAPACTLAGILAAVGMQAVRKELLSVTRCCSNKCRKSKPFAALRGAG
jgi:hypothetical protein